MQVPGAVERIQEHLHMMVDTQQAHSALIAVSYGSATMWSGCAGPVPDNALVPLACAGKPVLASTAAALVERGELHFTTRLDELLDLDFGEHSSPTIEQVLQQTSGLPSFVPPAGLRKTIPLHFEPGTRARYNPQFAWFLLARAIERATASSARDLMREHIDLLCGPSHSFTFGIPYGDQAAIDRIVRPHDRAGSGWEVIETWTREDGVKIGDNRFKLFDPALGALSTIESLAGYYRALLRTAEAESSLFGLAQTMTTRRRPEMSDDLLGSHFAWGLGLTLDVYRVGASRVSRPGSFGHAGYLGEHQTVLGWADTNHDVACAIAIQGLVPRGGTRFSSLARAMYRALGK